MSALLPIIQAAVEEGSSGTGNSHYSAVATCVRREVLSLKRKADFGPYQFDPADLRDDDEGTTLGKIYHGYQKVYWGAKRNVATEVTDCNLGKAADKAFRLFRAYANRFNHDDFAEIVAVEQPFPRNDTDQELLDYYVGAPYTFRPDLVVRLEEKHCKIAAEKRQLFGLEPGYYLWDHKSSKSKSDHEELIWRSHPQFRGYMACWNWLNPDKPVKGMVADRAIPYAKQEKLEAEGFFSVYVPYPTEAQISGWVKWIREQHNRLQTQPDSFNMSACFNYHRPCPHLVSGACDQT